MNLESEGSSTLVLSLRSKKISILQVYVSCWWNVFWVLCVWIDVPWFWFNATCLVLNDARRLRMRRLVPLSWVKSSFTTSFVVGHIVSVKRFNLFSWALKVGNIYSSEHVPDGWNTAWSTGSITPACWLFLSPGGGAQSTIEVKVDYCDYCN